MKRWINKTPSKTLAFVLGVIPFILVMALYQWGSDLRKAENPNDKLLPSVSQFYSAIDRLAFTPSKRTGEYLFWKDTLSSLKRLLMGVACAAAIALILGLITGAIPLVAANFNPIITTISLIPPMAVLPLLFIVFGLGELSKVMLIIVGITPFLIRDLYQKTKEIPQEQLVKAQTLGANSVQLINRVLLPQVLPRLLDALRLSLGTAWLFLIAAEAIAATEGLGYRIFLVRRYLSMDIILPYVIWITFLAFLLDWLLVHASKKAFPWYHSAK
ncbi:ABC transporter, permease protein [Marinomonas sp. MED121]|uniref:ABC transporter permease n=1 Tax=Marinomonas sp. MED121 TaxID=314277 RepID=UPI000069001B|nr:ABC transporter permease subunit [Marinomonas sp. MED121]EAQ66748.1 ABC transporter, permease protein [Marinomonas sp. MED121]